MDEPDKNAPEQPVDAEAAPAPETAAAPDPPDPKAEQLGAAIEHFINGNFAAARRTVKELLQGEVPPEIRKSADDLVHRLGLDPVALWVAAGSTLLFIIVVVMTYRR